MYVMYGFLEKQFAPYPMRKKVAETFLMHGLRVDEDANIFCANIELSPAKIGRAIGVDRRVVIETAEMIAKTKGLLGIFSGLQPKAFISEAAHNLGFEVIEIESEPHSIGIVSAVTRIVADAGISIRQIIADDPDIYPNPKLTLILEKKLPSDALTKLGKIKRITRISIQYGQARAKA